VTHGWIFDLDGTLVDSLPGIAASLNQALSDCELKCHDQQSVRTFIGDGAEMLVRRAVGAAGENAIAPVLEKFREYYAANWQHGTMPYDGIPEMLRQLRMRGDRLAVLSNKPHLYTCEIVAAIFPDTFDVIIGQRPGVPHKPDPAGVLEILALPEWRALTVAVIGDSVMDVQAAHAAGLRSIAVTWGYHDPSALASCKPHESADHVRDLSLLLFSRG
jgi:phosphoglycolate phosphatase